MPVRSPRLSSLAALGACIVVLLIAFPVQAGADAIPSPVQVESTARGHEYPGAPKDTKRCRKLLRQIERARDKENYERLNKLARRYNRTCRVK